MPGLHESWPEGAFYGFNEIYDEDRLDYRGPPFGWWSVPDQFVIARMDALGAAGRDVARAGLRVLPDDQHAHAVQSDAALPARLAARADRAAVRRAPSSSRPGNSIRTG